jgi:hypothetical protein
VQRDRLDIEAVGSAHLTLADQNLDPIDRRKTGTGRWVLVDGDDLLDGNQLSVARTPIAHPGGVNFCRLALRKGDGASPVRRPGAVIITNDGLGLAVAKRDLVVGHRGTSFKGGRLSSD